MVSDKHPKVSLRHSCTCKLASSFVLFAFSRSIDCRPFVCKNEFLSPTHKLTHLTHIVVLHHYAFCSCTVSVLSKEFAYLSYPRVSTQSMCKSVLARHQSMDAICRSCRSSNEEIPPCIPSHFLHAYRSSMLASLGTISRLLVIIYCKAKYC